MVILPLNSSHSAQAKGRVELQCLTRGRGCGAENEYASSSRSDLACLAWGLVCRVTWLISHF